MASALALVLGSLAAAYAFPPLFGLLFSDMQKFSIRLRDKYGLPIYALRMPGQRIYSVSSLSLITPLQRQSKTIAFAPIEAQAAANVMGVGSAENAVIGSPKMLDDGSYLSTFVPSVHPGLSPGLGLDALNAAAFQYLSTTTEATYRPKNPFGDPIVQEAWYTFEPSIMVHMLKAWPSVLARKILRAREQILIPAFEKYFAEDGHLQGSVLAQCRYQHNTGHGLRGRDAATTGIGQMVASLVNSVGSAFWMIYHVFSDLVVLGDCRKEVEQLVQEDDDGETLRYMHISIAARVHTDASIWGPTVGKFDHHRFLRVPGKKRTNPAAFRSFGGGTVLRPGRHFVSTEVLSFAAMFLLCFELKPSTKRGKWVQPAMNFPMTSSMPTPKDRLAIEIIPRDSREWRMGFSASNKGVNMVAEDVVNDDK
ncbi:cytochrome P450 [Nemania abortiva]|nr:cytochrome P450 [Nemania abortiva]